MVYLNTAVYWSDVVPELESLAGLLEEQLSNQSPLNNDTTHGQCVVSFMVAYTYCFTHLHMQWVMAGLHQFKHTYYQRLADSEMRRGKHLS